MVCEIARSKIISFKSWCPDTQHTYRYTESYLDHQNGRQ